MPPARIRRQPTALVRGLLRCGVAAGPVFITAFLLEGAIREGYRPLRHPVSSLALGSRGWIQTMNFTAAGTLFLAGAAGLGGAAGMAGAAGLAGASEPDTVPGPAAALIGAAGAGLLGAAAFPTDPVSGYPPGTTGAVAGSRTGNLHNLAAVPVFLGLPAAAVGSGGRAWRSGHRAFALYSAVSAASMVGATVLSSAGFGQSPRFVDQAGLFQRISIVAGFSWLSVVCARVMRSVPAAEPSGRDR